MWREDGTTNVIGQPWRTFTTNVTTFTSEINRVLAANTSEEAGDRMTGEPISMTEDYPLGTLAEHGATEVTRTLSGWVDNRGTEYGTRDLIRDGYTLNTLGPVPLHETLDQYKQRFRTTVIGGAHYGGVSVRPVMDALAALHVPDYPVSPGMYVSPHDADLRRSLPANTVVQVGVPEVWNHFGVFRLNDGAWRYLTGHLATFESIGQVLVMPGVEPAEWTLGEWTEEQAALVQQFMVQAWDIGKKAQSSNSWCSTYNTVMERANISDEWMQRPQPMTLAQVRALPVGAYLFWQDDLNLAIFQRDDDAENGLRQMWGSTGTPLTPNDGDRMQQLLVHADEPGFSPPSMGFLDNLPVGSVAVIERTNRVKKADGRWHHRPYTDASTGHRASDFTPDVSRTRIIEIGNGRWDFGTTMTAAQQAEQPEGTVFYWTTGGRDWGWVVRDDSADNPARTRRLFSPTDQDDWKAEAMWMGTDGNVPILEPGHLDRLPNGSTIRYAATTYTLMNRTWRATPGGYANGAQDFAHVIRNREVILRSIGNLDTPAGPTRNERVRRQRQLYDLPDGTVLRRTSDGHQLRKYGNLLVDETSGTERTLDQSWSSVSAGTLIALVPDLLDATVITTGMRVTRRAGVPHTLQGTGNYHEAEPGQPGTVGDQVNRNAFGNTWVVVWDHNGQTSHIDGNCLEVIA